MSRGASGNTRIARSSDLIQAALQGKESRLPRGQGIFVSTPPGLRVASTTLKMQISSPTGSQASRNAWRKGSTVRWPPPRGFRQIVAAILGAGTARIRLGLIAVDPASRRWIRNAWNRRRRGITTRRSLRPPDSSATTALSLPRPGRAIPTEPGGISTTAVVSAERLRRCQSFGFDTPGVCGQPPPRPEETLFVASACSWLACGSAEPAQFHRVPEAGGGEPKTRLLRASAVLRGAAPPHRVDGVRPTAGNDLRPPDAGTGAGVGAGGGLSLGFPSLHAVHRATGLRRTLKHHGACPLIFAWQDACSRGLHPLMTERISPKFRARGSGNLSRLDDVG